MTSPISHYQDFYENLEKDLDSLDSYNQNSNKPKISHKIFNTIVRLNPKILIPILFVIVLIILYYVKPQIILKKDKKTKKSLNKISYPKLLMWSCIIVIPVILFYMLKFKLIIQK